MKTTWLPFCVSALAMLCTPSPRLQGQPPPPAADRLELATIRTDLQTGFANAGWKYDRYSDLPSLDAGKRMVVADLQGPGIIRHIHTTRHQNPAETARGVVLEIYFDESEQPAVHCPLADFFGDGCNGKSMDFSTPLIECAPWSYNCYIPMPFATRAKVVLRNDTTKDIMNYSYVEWEPLPQWQESLGYFHATWSHKLFQLSKDSHIEFINLQGAGHILGRQFSVATDEPGFRGFNIVMEGNNEVSIDGQERAIDYLGTEDSFTFSWGFQKTFAGLRAGMPFVAPENPSMLSIYRFHDHQPIRFQRQLSWAINWREEHFFTAQPLWAQRVAADGCWVQYDTVFYWYQNSPAGYQHEPLPPLEKRQTVLAKSSAAEANLDELIKAAPVDEQLSNAFEAEEDLKRVQIAGCYVGTHPFWIDVPAHKGGHPGNPNPGRKGILAVHAQSEVVPAFVVRKVNLPADKPCKLRLVVSGDPYEAPGKSDFLVTAGLHDGQQFHWFATETVDAGNPPSDGNWRTFEYPLSAFAGNTVALVVKVAYGGRVAVFNEEAFFDEISVVTEQ